MQFETILDDRRSHCRVWYSSAVVGPVSITTPALAQNMTGDMGGNMTGDTMKLEIIPTWVNPHPLVIHTFFIFL